MEVSSASDFGSSMKGKGPTGFGLRRSSAGTGSFSCFHGEAKRPPVDDATVRDCIETTRYIDEFYKEAARRLPLKEMPELDACIHAGGLCFGLADPVANIILNGVGLLHHLHDQEEGFPPPPAQRATRGCADIATRSLLGLRGFMTVYFRYLSHTDGCRYLYLASQDLRLAIALVHHDRFSPNSESQRRPLLPDGGNLRAALRVAALDANHPFPDVLARFMTARYPSDLLCPVLAKLQAAEHQLTTRDISEIRDLLARQWPPATPPPVNLDFWCRPNGKTCALAEDGTLVISTCIGEGLVAKISIAKQNSSQLLDCDHQQQLGHISDITFQSSKDVLETKQLSDDCLQVQVQAVGVGIAETEVDYGASPCTHTFVLEMCLLETIHTCYIKALAALPHNSNSPGLLRALIVAGHCYGPFDPVRNVIVNTIWYDTNFPAATPPDAAEVDLPWGILDTRPLSRLESRSLDGLVQMVNKSRHKALEYLNSLDCDLSTTAPQSESRCLLRGQIDFGFVAKAAKHPQHAAHGSFLMSLSPEHIDYMRCLLTLDDDGGGIPPDCWSQAVHESILSSSMPAPPQNQQETHLCSLSPFDLFKISRTKSKYMNKLAFVSSELNKMLHKYCNQHPWEPAYQLDIVCGVREPRSHNRPSFYHANFLASTAAGKGVPHKRTLFFAEFWVSPSPEDVQSKPSSICCPIYDYSYACTGRCSFCEGEGIKIMHPPSGGYSGVIDRQNPFLPSYRAGLKNVLVSDLIYSDPDRDVELAKVINDFHDYKCNDTPLVPCTPRAKSSLPWGWNGDCDNAFGTLPEITKLPKLIFYTEAELDIAFARLTIS